MPFKNIYEVKLQRYIYTNIYLLIRLEYIHTFVEVRHNKQQNSAVQRHNIKTFQEANLYIAYFVSVENNNYLQGLRVEFQFLVPRRITHVD